MNRLISVIVAAAGRAQRMQGPDKLYIPLRGIPVLARTLLALENCPSVGEIILVAREECIAQARELAYRFGISRLAAVTAGAETRQRSVACGLEMVDPGAEYIAVQDGARPLLTPELFRRCASDCIKHGAAAPAVRMKDTVKRRDENGFIAETLDRDKLYAVQTPQIFEAAGYRAALESALAQEMDFTDDCLLYEHAGRPVFLSEGSYENIKITTAEDLLLAEAVLERRERACDENRAGV